MTSLTNRVCRLPRRRQNKDQSPQLFDSPNQQVVRAAERDASDIFPGQSSAALLPQPGIHGRHFTCPCAPYPASKDMRFQLFVLRRLNSRHPETSCFSPFDSFIIINHPRRTLKRCYQLRITWNVCQSRCQDRGFLLMGMRPRGTNTSHDGNKFAYGHLGLPAIAKHLLNT